MADKRTQRRYLSRLGGGVFGLLLILGFVWFVRTMMAGKTNKPPRQVQIVQLIRPPPPPPDQPPPPPPEKTDEPLPKDVPEPTPNDEPPPAESMGLDAQGSAGEDAFGFAARHGGSDLVGGNGSAAFAWYTNRIKDAVLDKLTGDPCVRSKKFSASARFWIAPDGRIKDVKLATSTGNHELDKCIEVALASMLRLSDAPPLEMPQPVTLKIMSHT
jgi:periplasmic protein TonB